MAFDFVGEGVRVEHNSAQNLLAAVYGLRHDFPELFLASGMAKHAYLSQRFIK
jgi:hypothetical protein